LGSSEDAHCFVHKDGWIVVYYRNTESTAKIVDWNWWDPVLLKLSGSINKLQAALEKMGLAFPGLTLNFIRTNMKYYDFRYSDATMFMLVVKMQPAGNIPPNPASVSLSIKLPGNFTFRSESWSHYSGSTDGTLTIDGALIDTITYATTHFGDLPSPLVQESFHSVSLNRATGYQYFGIHTCCILLEYKESV
jgi:hypothetical protein